MRYIFIPAILIALINTSPAQANDLALIEAARARLAADVQYDPTYVRLDYPDGDVPATKGVCTDVVIRSLRAAHSFDLQSAVHEDMRQDFDAYPSLWGLDGPDRNIDHRRVPNLEAYFTRHGYALPIGDNADAFQPGDIVSWRLGGRIAHIGIVSDRKTPTGIPLIIHNIGAGPEESDILFGHVITGHFRWTASEIG